MSDNGEIVIGGDAQDIPPGSYPGKVKSIVVRTSDLYGDFRRWEFELDNGSIVDGVTSMNTNRRSKGGKWIAALLGRVPEAKESVNVIGKPCLVVVGLNKDDWPTVEGIMPPMAGATIHPADAAVLTELP